MDLFTRRLIDSITEQEFDRKVMSLKATWDCLQPGFHSWFVKFETDLFKRHLIACVTKLARIDKHYCTNKVESTNDNINDWLGRSQFPGNKSENRRRICKSTTTGI